MTSDDPRAPHETPADGPPAPKPPRRLGVVLGDRLCVECGFNLHGQTITREEHYQMLAVRCPECSTLASLQEYPVLGKWGARFGMVLALAWLAVALGAVFLTGLTLYLSAEGVAGTTTLPAARQIGEAYKAYLTTAADQTPASLQQIGITDPMTAFDGWDAASIWVDEDWLAGEDVAAIAEGHRDGVYWVRMLVSAIPLVLGAGAWGVVWSVLVLHRRLVRPLILTGIIAGLCVPLVVLSHWGSAAGSDGFGPWSSYRWGVGITTRSIAVRELGLLPALVALGLGYLGLVLGLRFGRKLVRGIVRLLLPPNLRGSLALLWHVDGLPSPGGSGRRGGYWIRG